MTTAATTIILVRHGNVHNPRGVLYGRLPRFRLSARGLEEARAAGRLLGRSRLDGLFTSPLLRARQTAAAILAFHPGLPLRRTRHLIEVLSAYEGRPAAEVDARGGDVYTGTGPPYEQPADIAGRVRRFFDRVRRRHAGGTVAAVTHGDVIVFAALWARGLPLAPPDRALLRRVGFPEGYPATGSLTTFFFRTDSGRELPEVLHRVP
jgi:probable phosphoglycerate mutase